jgi:tetratricopeptide (TPR) repeat protein
VRLAASSHSEVRIEFEQLCQEIRAGDNPYYGQEDLLTYQGWVEQQNANPSAQATALSRLALAELRFGDAEGAAERLDEAYSIVASAGLDSELSLDILRHAALAYLRLGEQRNCVDHRSASACILPFDADAVHQDQRGSEAALERYLQLLESDPGNPIVTWLVNISAMTLGDWPDAVPSGWRMEPEALRTHYPFAPLVDRARERGLNLRRPSGGAVIDDFDGDGDLDLITSSIDPCASLQLWINDGSGNFTDQTAGSGLDVQLGGLNLNHADFDNDGDLDLLVLRGGWFGKHGLHRNSLLRNDGLAHFEDVTADAGIGEPAYPTQTAAWGDYDNDGDLDLYVGNEAAEDLYADGKSSETAFASQLFRNDGSGRFVDIAQSAGVGNDRFVKGVTWGDYDNDGDLDLYVSNIGPNRLYRNDSPRGFLDVAEDSGVAEPVGRSFATWFFDFDNDGWLDIFVADYGASFEQVAAYQLGADVGPGGRPLIYRNLGDGRFEESGIRLGLQEPLLPMGANFGDLDQDGWLDLYLGTGAPSYEALMPNRLYRNRRGEFFEDVTDAARVGHLQKGHGVAFADLDADGDQDLFEQMGGAFPGDAYPSVMYVNPGGMGSSLEIELRGVATNHFGIGARVQVRYETASGVEHSIHRVIGSGGSFGGNPLRQAIGLGAYSGSVKVSVLWPGGAAGGESFGELTPGARFILRQGGGVEKIPLK